VLTVAFPYDIFEGQQVIVKTAIGMSPIIKRMAYTLLMTILLSVFLIFCLVYQILTISKQRHIEAVRQEFLHTMIHELKRPISTLKMCVSFMGNERMMQDEESKQRILTSSHNELDNLTSYFSKLRDITLNDVAENAIKYSHEAVTIHIDYQQRTDGLLQISVADNGIGIARADQRYVFDKFYRS